MSKISINEIDAIRVYIGDIRKRNSDGKISDMKIKDDIYGNKNIYKTLNALFYHGIENEKNRIIEENGKLCDSIFNRMSEIVNLYCDIYTAMCKYIRGHKDTVYSKRIDRYDALNSFEYCHTISFTSTSKNDYNPEFSNKNGIILLEYEISPVTPHLDLFDVLQDEYLHESEHEILLPPFIPIEITTCRLNEKDMFIRDMRGDIPKGKYKIKTLPKSKNFFNSYDMKERYMEEVYDKDNLIMASDEIDIMNKERRNSNNLKHYIKWKENFINYMKCLFMDIENEILYNK